MTTHITQDKQVPGQQTIDSANGSFTLAKVNDLQTETVYRALEAIHHSTQQLTFSHTTALLILGVELPPHLLRTARNELHVCFAKRQRRYQDSPRPHTWQQPIDQRVPVNNILCCGPVAAWAQCAASLSVRDLVLLGDALMRRDAKLKLATLAEFESYLANSTKFPGKHRCELALRLMRENTDSMQETLTRLIIVQHGLPCPMVNYSIVLGDGRMLYIDMSYPGLKIAIEYQGKQHDNDPAQIRSDRRKRNYIVSNAWKELEPDSGILNSRDREMEFVYNLAALLTERLGLEIRAFPKMTLEQTLDRRKLHNRRNSTLHEALYTVH